MLGPWGQWVPKSLGRKLLKTFGHGGKESKTCIIKTHSLSGSNARGPWKQRSSHCTGGEIEAQRGPEQGLGVTQQGRS